MKVVIGTKNPGKIEGAKKALSYYYEDIEIQGIPVEPDVGEQPVNDEIYIGAKNRVKNLKKYCKDNNIQADLYLSIESGITNSDLSQAMDKVLGEDKERHNKAGGIQLLTHNKVTRIDLTEMAFTMALTKYINGETWK